MSLERTADVQPFPDAAFADVLSANERYVARHPESDLTGWAARGLAVVTCMDSRIAPLSVLGMQPGDAKILRNAGARNVHDFAIRQRRRNKHALRVIQPKATGCRIAQHRQRFV